MSQRLIRMLGLLHQLQIAEESRGPGCRAVCREFSDAWKIALEDLKSRVQANAEIGRYPRLSNPQVFDLFDTYQAFRRVMDGVDRLNFVADFDGEHNQVLFAEAYSTLSKSLAGLAML